MVVNSAMVPVILATLVIRTLVHMYHTTVFINVRLILNPRLNQHLSLKLKLAMVSNTILMAALAIVMVQVIQPMDTHHIDHLAMVMDTLVTLLMEVVITQLTLMYLFIESTSVKLIPNQQLKQILVMDTVMV